MGFGIVSFTRPALGIGAAGVEIAQRNRLQALGWDAGFQHHLNHYLAVAVRVDGCAGQALMQKRHVGVVAIGRGGGGEDELSHTRCLHRLKQGQRARDIVFKERQRGDDGLTRFDQSGEMHHAVDIVCSQRRLKCCAVRQLSFDKRSPEAGVAMAGGEIVVNDGFETSIVQRQCGVGADVASPADDQNSLLICHVVQTPPDTLPNGGLIPIRRAQSQ